MTAVNSKINNSWLHIANPAIAQQHKKHIPSRLLEYLKTDPLIKHKEKILKEIKVISTKNLHSVLDEFFLYLVAEGKKVDSEKSLNRLAETIPFKKLQDIIRVKHPKYIDALKEAKNLLKDAQTYLEMRNDQNTFSLTIKLRHVLNALSTCLESVIAAFGVADFFKPSETDLQTNTKIQRFFTFLSLFSVLTAALLPLLGAGVTAPIVGGVLLFMAVLSLVYPYIKPMPHRIQKLTNWTQLVQEGKLAVLQANKKYLDQMAQVLIGGKNAKIKTHPMLIGPSGIGKTETVKAFVKAVENGDYPELKGKRFFYVNSADLLNAPGRQDGGSKELQRISEVMGRHRKNIVLIFDEIHILCQKKNNVLGEQLKTILEDAHQGFPNVIGITTLQEFNRDIYQNEAFERRFKKINIENPEDEDVERILGATLIQREPSALTDNHALAYLHKKTKEAFPKGAQPATSIKILSQCIRQTSEAQKSEVKDKIDQTRKKMDHLIAKNINGKMSELSDDPENNEPIQAMEKSLNKLEQDFISYQTEIEQIYQTREKLGKVKRKVYENVIKISKFTKKLSKREKKLINKNLLQKYFLASAMEKHIHEKSSKLNLKGMNVKAVINNSLIDEVIEAEKKNQQEVNQAVLQGKKDLDMRENGAKEAEVVK